MAWEAILSTDPRFETDFDIDDIDIDDDDVQGLLIPLLHVRKAHPDHHIQFYNKENRRRYSVGLDRPIKPLSTVDSTDSNNIIELIKYVPEGEVLLSHQTTFVKDEKDADLQELLCSFAILGNGIRWGAYAIYFDKPLPECYIWARNFENTIRAVVPNVQFQNRIGLCNDCTNTLRLEEHAIRNTVGWGIFLCDECCIRREIQSKREEDLRKEAAKQKREARKKGLPTFTPNQIILPSEKLGRALYQLYGGKCQYCAFPEPLPKDKVVIEHIIPRSIPLSSIHARLQEMGVSNAAAQHFCENLLPPYHDCVLNYTLSCLKHNSIKGGNLLNMASLEMALQRAKRKAGKLLVLYSFMSSS